MALWGDKDNISVGTGATAYISSYTKNDTYGGYPVVGSGSVWGSSGYAQEGDVIRFGNVGNSVAGAGGTYYGEAIIVNIQSVTSCYIASTEGIKSGWLASAGVATVFTVSQSPKFAIQDGRWSVRNTDADTYTAGVSTGGATQAFTTQYETGVGWVGVQTYIDSGSNLRVKKEVLVSMSGIATGNAPIYDSNPTA
tara:strand:- start:1355 stop:1939 length:585 start_codon:yes stop_codon:yes gene_type:complete